jgi:hypothetical protein
MVAAALSLFQDSSSWLGLAMIGLRGAVRCLFVDAGKALLELGFLAGYEICGLRYSLWCKERRLAGYCRELRGFMIAFLFE